VIVKHATNAAGMGIILRGIDAARAPHVLGIERTLKEGKLSHLDHPEEIPTDIFPEAGGGTDTARPAARVLPGILMGEELFQHILRVFVGSEVDVACPLCGVGPVGPMPKLKPFRVAGTSTRACTSSIPSWPTCRCATRRSSWAWKGR